VSGIARAVRLDLVDEMLELHSQVLGDSAPFLIGKDEIQVLAR
jgi:hypothetical protein